jgi:hypothetical protein
MSFSFFIHFYALMATFSAASIILHPYYSPYQRFTQQ